MAPIFVPGWGAPSKLDLVADYILRAANEAGEPVTNLKLQKLVYYCQAWSLALREKPLFDEKIKAWVHGPVIPQLYHRFKSAGNQPIDAEPEAPSLTEEECDLIDKVLDVYLGFSSWDLERLTHAEEPWIEARGGLPPGEPCETEISTQTMARFYRARSEAAAATQSNG
jgi:uncharacterized phage-associated protein